MTGLSSRVIDRFGSCVSFLCAVHCALKPLLFLVPSVVGLDVLRSHSLERVLLGIGVFLVLGSTLFGFRRHRQLSIFVPVGLALALILIGRFAGEQPVRTVLTVGGGLAIAFTHLMNLRFERTCRKKEACSVDP